MNQYTKIHPRCHPLWPSMAAINVFGAPCWLCLCHRLLSLRSPSNWISPRTARSKGEKNNNKKHGHHKIWAQNFSRFFPVFWRFSSSFMFRPLWHPQHLAPCRNRAPLRHPAIAPQPWHQQIAPNHGTHTQAWHPAATSRGPFVSTERTRQTLGFVAMGFVLL